MLLALMKGLILLIVLAVLIPRLVIVVLVATKTLHLLADETRSIVSLLPIVIVMAALVAM
jgi:hypothetical protein